MAGETLCMLPKAPSYGDLALEMKAQLYPDPPTGGGSARPVAGQAWPRGNARGNG